MAKKKRKRKRTSQKPITPSLTKKRGGRGSHGSLTKAGKVGSFNKIQWRENKKGKKFHGKKHKNPRTRNRRNYRVRIILNKGSIYGY